MRSPLTNNSSPLDLIADTGYCYSLRSGWDSHVTVANEWLTKLPQKSPEEEAKLLEIAEDISPK